MAPRKKTIENYVQEIMELNCSLEDQEVKLIINKAADKFKSKSTSEAKTLRLTAREKEVDLEKELLEKRTTASHEEIESLEAKIKEYIIVQRIWDQAMITRKEVYYKRPTLPYGDIFSTSGISSVSTSKSSKNDAESLKTDVLVRDNRRTKIYHPSHKELTLQDAKVLIGIHKLWEESGKKKDFEFTIYALAKTINRSMSGKTYNEIWNSLEVLQDSKFEFVYFYDEGLIDSLDRVNILQAIGRRDKNSTFKVTFSDFIYDSLQSGAITYLSLAILEDLSTNTAQNLYLFFPSQVAKGITRWNIDEICDLMGIKASRPVKKKTIIKNACDNMVELSLLDDYEIHEDESGSRFLSITPSELMTRSSNKIISNSKKIEQLEIKF